MTPILIHRQHEGSGVAQALMRQHNCSFEDIPVDFVVHDAIAVLLFTEEQPPWGVEQSRRCGALGRYPRRLVLIRDAVAGTDALGRQQALLAVQYGASVLLYTTDGDVVGLVGAIVACDPYARAPAAPDEAPVTRSLQRLPGVGVTTAKKLTEAGLSLRELCRLPAAEIARRAAVPVAVASGIVAFLNGDG